MCHIYLFMNLSLLIFIAHFTLVAQLFDATNLYTYLDIITFCYLVFSLVLFYIFILCIVSLILQKLRNNFHHVHIQAVYCFHVSLKVHTLTKKTSHWESPSSIFRCGLAQICVITEERGWLEYHLEIISLYHELNHVCLLQWAVFVSYLQLLKWMLCLWRTTLHSSISLDEKICFPRKRFVGTITGKTTPQLRKAMLMRPRKQVDALRSLFCPDSFRHQVTHQEENMERIPWSWHNCGLG